MRSHDDLTDAGLEPPHRWRLAVRQVPVLLVAALLLTVSGAAAAATGGNLVLGRSNSADAVTTLTSSSGSALSLRSPSGVAPLQVNRSVRVERLNADLLDGRDSTGFARLGTTNSAARTTLTNPSGPPLRLTSGAGSAPFEVTSTVKVRNLNADLLDGRDASEFAPAAGLTSLASQHRELREQHEALRGQHDALQQRFDALQNEHTALDDRLTALEDLLAGASRATVGGRDTLTLSGVNLQLVNGTGSTTKANGLGNLLVGYGVASPDAVRTGSHYVVVGDGHSWAASSGVVAGGGHRALGHGASVIGGNGNTASGEYAAVVGGQSNRATGWYATVSGGVQNTAGGDPGRPFWTGDFTSVSGGASNTATGLASSISGGSHGTTTGFYSSILGGQGATTPDPHGCAPAC